MIKKGGRRALFAAVAAGLGIGLWAGGANAQEPFLSPALLTAQLEKLRDGLSRLASAAPRLPDELSLAGLNLYYELYEQGLASAAALTVIFFALGLGAETLARRLSASAAARAAAQPIRAPSDRLTAAGARLMFELGAAAAFAAGSVGGFLLFSWSPLLSDIVLGFLTALLGARLTAELCDFVLAPTSSSQLRLLPMTEAEAAFWRRRVVLIISGLLFAWVVLSLLRTLGVSADGVGLIGAAVDAVLLAAGLDSVFRRPRSCENDGCGAGDWGAAAVLCCLWLLWTLGAKTPFWLLFFAVATPMAIVGARRAASALLRPVDGAATIDGDQVVAAASECGARLLIIVCAALLLLRALDVEIADLASDSAPTTQLLRGLLHALVVIFAADFIWRVGRAAIDARLARATASFDPDDPEVARRRARLLTLLPIFRNVLAAAVAVIAGLTALSALGVDVGPLAAGAGVIGVAVGFGAQTLVRDVISGVFYMLDDAFRIGEYIQCGEYRGVVESFSLRSIKLRHHRGSIFTVPFGVLGAVQNMSRDWALDRLTIKVAFDADIELVRRLADDVGAALQADPEWGRFILEPLSLQGVQAIGDYSTELRFRIKTLPGEEMFKIRRRAYGLLKEAFDANGVKMGVPMMRVSASGPSPLQPADTGTV